MDLGIFAKTFQKKSLPEILEAALEHGLKHVQFNMLCAGLPSLPDSIESSEIGAISTEFQKRNMIISAVSGTYNMIHPDLTIRQKGLEKLSVIIDACKGLGSNIVTLCTGTRDPDDQWKAHPDNGLPAAWNDLTHSMSQALEKAERANVILAVEPELANVINTSEKARRLLDEMRSDNLKIVFDAANLFEMTSISEQHRLVDQALDLLGEQIVIAHAKDRSSDGSFVAAGKGVLDYRHYFSGLKRVGFDGPFIMHGLSETEVPESLSYIRNIMAHFDHKAKRAL